MRYRAKISLLPLAGFVSVLGACAGQPRATPAPAPPPASARATPEAAPSPSSAVPAAGTPSAPAGTAAPVASTPAPVSAVASTKREASWSRCHHGYKAATRDVSIGVAALAKTCESATRMKLVGKTRTGAQADQDKPESFALDARAGHCYRVYAQASEGIKDLDIVVRDSAGIPIGEDSTDDPNPVVLDDGAACFAKDDKASVVVSVGMGSGVYAIQIWSD